ncbi:MAG: hypothetical protein ACPG8V_01495 [Alphaproteobacteria bacterium]
MIKKLFAFIFIGLFINPAYANKTVEFGYGMYVGGLNVADAKAELKISESNDYSFKAFIFSQGLASFVTAFNFVTESKGKIIDDKIQFKSQVSSSTSNFGDTYTVLKRDENGHTTITKYPDPEAVDIADLPGNPLAKANDPISSILTLMQQIKFNGKCDIDMTIVTNHYLYQAKSKSTTSKVLKADNYNIASGKATSCLVEFHRLDKQDDISAYDELDQGESHKSTYPTFHFIKLDGIPYFIPVSIEATEQRFGEFRLNLQYVKYGDKVYKAEEWDEADSFPSGDIENLKTVKEKLLSEAK